ncbi:glycosyltransferase family 4 protein [Dokdonella soli]|uniref:Glycosyltransferase family 4 protein n=1 Tax=Dokdonella soli TaxID=529810 RepID=A0ABN1ICJ0_9GAMM
MAVWSLAEWAIVAAVALVLAASCTHFSIAYALHRQLLDQPGQRRSHQVPTPRGGGIGIVVGALFVIALFAAQSESSIRALALSVMAAVVVVGMVGWIDDHGGLRARTRLAAHCLAALVLLATPAVLIGLSDPITGRGALLMYTLAAVFPGLAIVWSINLHNFMDGIDGLLALQAMFVLGTLAWICLLTGYPGQAGCIGACAIAAGGFLPFNFPRARIFMGDVGSGVLGLLVAIAVLWQMATPGIALASGIVLCSAFVTDATCTLLSRMLRGRRWYSAHREHLYQWLVRCGFSHARVVALYMGWNLLIVLPAVYWMNRMARTGASIVDGPTTNRFGPAVAVYALACTVWWLGKRWCLRNVTTRSRHAAA